MGWLIDAHVDIYAYSVCIICIRFKLMYPYIYMYTCICLHTWQRKVVCRALHMCGWILGAQIMIQTYVYMYRHSCNTLQHTATHCNTLQRKRIYICAAQHRGRKSWFKSMYKCTYICIGLQGDEDALDALRCRLFSAKEPLIIGLFCGKWPVKIRHPTSLRHAVDLAHSKLQD